MAEDFQQFMMQAVDSFAKTTGEIGKEAFSRLGGLLAMIPGLGGLGEAMARGSGRDSGGEVPGYTPSSTPSITPVRTPEESVAQVKAVIPQQSPAMSEIKDISALAASWGSQISAAGASIAASMREVDMSTHGVMANTNANIGVAQRGGPGAAVAV